MSRTVNFVLVRHLPKPAGLTGAAADAICPERGPKRLAQLRRALTEDLGITTPTLVAHSEFATTRGLATLLYPDAPKLELPGLGYAWLEPMYGDLYESWEAMEQRLGKPVIEATAQEVYEVWPEARSIVPSMVATLEGLHFAACQRVPEETEVPTVVVISHTGILELAFEFEADRTDMKMLGEGGIITFSAAPDDQKGFDIGLPTQIWPEALYPDAEPEAMLVPLHPAGA